MWEKQGQQKRLFLAGMLVICLTAVALRLVALTRIPPGLTHDEADHGITAISILAGTRAVYFTIGHGREPLYDYATAAMMAGIGPTSLASRLTAVAFGLIMIAGMAAWVRRAFDWQTAVLTAAGLAVGFWPLMAARQALRSITLPALFVLALYFFWEGLKKVERKDENHNQLQSSVICFLLAGVFFGLTFYTYIPARALWLLFPLVLGYVRVGQRALFQRAWPRVLFMLMVAGLLGGPLFLYLQANPMAEIRLRELSGPLTAAAGGDLHPLWQNVTAGLGIIAFRGDDFWRYNLPGRPLLGPVMAVLFGGGLVLAGWWAVRSFGRQPGAQWCGAASFLAIGWLLIGIAPVLVTGPHLSTTQAMGMQPVLYLFPALAIRQIGKWSMAGYRLEASRWGQLAVVMLFAGTAVFTSRDYFLIWASAPAVRVQYEAAMTAVMRYLNVSDMHDVAVSTITPEQYHTPAVAAMTLTNEAVTPRWFDGRASLLIPHTPEAVIILSGFAALPEALAGYLATAGRPATIPQPPTDLDRPLTVYRVNAADWLAEYHPDFTSVADARFGQVAQLLGYDLPATAVVAGGQVPVVTLWRLQQPAAGLRLFTHVSAPDGALVAQADGLSAPGDAWVAGDILLQLHELSLPAASAPGRYPLTIGLYTCLDASCEQTQRLPVFIDGIPAGDHLYLQDLSISQ